ncbi:arylsulfotransferase family protein [Aspergillus homomorphus CBS 101889]|uniref:Arylsulfotransferase n=1 Tax=Aspergillus homomorphus (strain CBS 101889) TaxID=1450537 RepID=A0A395I1H5_ASPHC|nr:hypothetical protein BO97DRAFT_423740 [Aspergillus homomorphus CBS 101889]RAL13539.1 hypothetical protein BO97DRAFT_423740 [Aspergillus homomorphus CBS 101889]
MAIHWKRKLGLASILAFTSPADCANGVSYQSRPDIRAPVLEISFKNDSLITPGYIFIAPYYGDMPGPYIYDTNANLVWSGADGSTTDIFHDLHVCAYNGSDHLCYFQGEQIGGYARGHHEILDRSYSPSASVESGNGLEMSDMHESAVINSTSMLIPIYQPRTTDLTAYNIVPGPGWVIDSVFQEIDIASGAVLFQWSSLDHVATSESYTPPGLNQVVGDGRSNASAWDYFHINSIDKNGEGDYLVSARHTSGIYKISGADGSVMWRLGGTNSTIQLANYNFSSQHDARFREENATTTVLSLFDNGSDKYRNTSAFSSGMIVAIDHTTDTSTLLRSYTAPSAGIQAWSQGNCQILPNRNAFIGWGNIPSMSEHLEDGTPVFFASIADFHTMNYRAYKYEWSAQPHEPPALRAYSPSPNAATTFWMSWNGATEVDYWNIYASTSAAADQLTPIAQADNVGFQTTYTSSAYHPKAFVEAIGKDGRSLANSSTVSTSSILPG